MKITGWGFRDIVENLPFSAGMQILHADDYAHGRHSAFANNERSIDFDALASIDEAIQKHGKV